MRTWHVMVKYRVPRVGSGWAVLVEHVVEFPAIEAVTEREARETGERLARLDDPAILPWSITSWAKGNRRSDT